MYETVNQYLKRLQAAPRVAPHDVDNDRTRHSLLQYRHIEKWRDLADEVLTPDLEYLIDVMDRADAVVDKIADIFDPENLDIIYHEATAQETAIFKVARRGGYVPESKIRDVAHSNLVLASQEKLRERFVETMARHPQHAAHVARTLHAATGETPSRDDVRDVIRLMPVKPAYTTLDVVRAVDEYLAKREREREEVSAT